VQGRVRGGEERSEGWGVKEKKEKGEEREGKGDTHHTNPSLVLAPLATSAYIMR